MENNDEKQNDEKNVSTEETINETKKEVVTTEESEVNHRVEFLRTEQIYPEELKQHPINATLYQDESVDLDLVDSIRKKGLVEPLIIKEDKTIISGHRRWRALKYINETKLGRIIVNSKDDKVADMPFIYRTAICHVVRFKSTEEEQLAIVEYNRRRLKRMSQMYNEIEMLHDVFDGVAQNNSRANLKQNSGAPTLVRRLKEAVKNGEIDEQEIDWSLTPTEIACQYGHLVGGPKFTDKEEYDKSKAETNTKIGKVLGIGKTTVANLTEVGRLAKDFSDPHAVKSMELMDRGIWKIGAAHKYVWLRKRVLSRNEPGSVIAKELIQDIDAGIRIKEKKEKGKILTPAAAVKEFQKLVKSEEEKIDLYSGPRKVTYSVLYFDFPAIEPYNISEENAYELPEEIKNVFTPPANNSAMFIAANSKNLTQASLYLTRWGFKLRSYILIKEKKGHEMLLFCIRGSCAMPNPENWPSTMIQNKSSIPQLIRSIYPEEGSFWEVHLDKYHTQPEGWGKSLEQIKAEKEVAEREAAKQEENEVDDEDTKEEGGGVAPAVRGAWM